MVLPGRIELTTSPLPRECSTTELRQRRSAVWEIEDRTRVGKECGPPPDAAGVARATARRLLREGPQWTSAAGTETIRRDPPRGGTIQARTTRQSRAEEESRECVSTISPRRSASRSSSPDLPARRTAR